MAGHVEFRHHADAAIVRVGNQVTDLFLRVVHPVGAITGQLGKNLAFRAESLIVG